MKSGEPTTELATIWLAMTELYLDQEFAERDAWQVAEILAQSAYTDAELQRILLDDVHPVFWTNLATVAGEWAGFNREEAVFAIVNYKLVVDKAETAANGKHAILRWLFYRRKEMLARVQTVMSHGVTQIILKEWALVRANISMIRKNHVHATQKENASSRSD